MVKSRRKGKEEKIFYQAWKNEMTKSEGEND
jgi:hypothetical protein